MGSVGFGPSENSMKISKKSISSTSYTSAASSYGKTQKVSGSQPLDDSVEVSPSGSLFQAALGVAANTPDIRTEAIQGIQAEFAEGRYHRDEFDVADKVIQEQLTSPLPVF